MSTLGLAYCVGIVAASLLGGLFPLARTVTHTRLQLYLALSGGVMLGASLLHMIPEAAESLGRGFGIYVTGGVLALYFLQRFVAPHSHEMEESVSQREPSVAEHHHAAASLHDSHGHERHHHHDSADSVSALAVIAGLSVHSVFAGVALGGAIETGHDAARALGFTVFLVVAMHKPADSLTVTAMLLRTGATHAKIALWQVMFSLLVPLGVLAFFAARGSMSEDFGGKLTGAVLAITAGMFICIALGDLLPEVQFHANDRIKLSAALLAGVLLMGLVKMVEPKHDHGSESPISAIQGDVERGAVDGAESADSAVGGAGGAADHAH